MYVDLQDRLRAEKDQVELREGQIRALCNEYYGLKSKHDELLEQLGSTNETVRTLSGTLEERTAENAKLRSETDELRSQLASLHQQHASAVIDLGDQSDRAHSLLDQLEEARKQLDESSQALRTSMEEKKELSREFMQRTAEIESLRNELERAQKKRTEAGALYLEERERHDRVRKIIDSKEKAQRRAEDELGQVRKDLERVSKREKLLEFHLQVMTSSNRGLDQQAAETSSRLRELTRENKKLEEELADSLKLCSEREIAIGDSLRQAEYWKTVAMRYIEAEAAAADKTEAMEVPPSHIPEIRSLDSLAVAEISCGAFLDALDAMQGDVSSAPALLASASSSRSSETRAAVREGVSPLADKTRLLRQKNSSLLASLRVGRNALQQTVCGELAAD